MEKTTWTIMCGKDVDIRRYNPLVQLENYISQHECYNKYASNQASKRQQILRSTTTYLRGICPQQFRIADLLVSFTELCNVRPALRFLS